MSHSEGVTGRLALQTRRAQGAFLTTAVYRVSGWLTSGISNFPSWSQSTWSNLDIWTAIIPFQYYPECTALTFTRQVRLWALGVPGASRGGPDRPNSLLLHKHKEGAKSLQFIAHQLTFLQKTLTLIASSNKV